VADLAKQGGDGPAINVSKDQIKRARTSWEREHRDTYSQAPLLDAGDLHSAATKESRES